MAIHRLPGSLYVHRPELLAVWEAISAFRFGMPITAVCPECEGTLSVERVASQRINEPNRFLVTCPAGCLNMYETER